MGRVLLPSEHEALVRAGLFEEYKVVRRSYTLKFKQEVIMYHQRALRVIGESASKHWTSTYFRVPYNTVRKWLSRTYSAAFSSAVASQSNSGGYSTSKRHHLRRRDCWSAALGVIEKRVLQKLLARREQGLRVSASTVCRWGREFSRCEDVAESMLLSTSMKALRSRIKFSRTWLSGFMSRHALSLRKPRSNSKRSPLPPSDSESCCPVTLIFVHA